ncbi:MAG: beta-propeller fold lactonase family protein, partial [Terriglobales bacterium]
MNRIASLFTSPLASTARNAARANAGPSLGDGRHPAAAASRRKPATDLSNWRLRTGPGGLPLAACCLLLLAVVCLLAPPTMSAQQQVTKITAGNTDQNTSGNNTQGWEGIAVDPVRNLIFIVNSASTTSGSTVTVINGATNQPVTGSPVTVGETATGIAVDPVHGVVYVNFCAYDNACYDAGSSGSGGVTAINENGLATASYSSSSASDPGPIVVDPFLGTNGTVYVGGDDAVLVFAGAAVSGTSISAPTLSTTLATHSLVYGLAVNYVGESVYVADDYKTIYEINSSNTLTSETLTNSTPCTSTPAPLSLAVNPVTGEVYTANYNSPCITALTSAIGSPSYIAAGTTPYAIAVNPVTNFVYVANEGAGTVTAINASNSNSTATIPTSGSMTGSPWDIAINAATNMVYVAMDNGDVYAFTGATSSTAAGTPVLIATGITSPNIQAVAVNPVTNKAYALSESTTSTYINVLSVIDGATNALATGSPVNTGTTPQAVAVNPGNPAASASTCSSSPSAANCDVATVYVVNNGGASVTAVNASTLSPTTVNVGTSPVAIAVDPVTNQAFVANSGSANMTVIDGGQGTLYPTTNVSTGTSSVPKAIAVNPVINYVYVANQGTNTVSVYDEQAATMVSTVPLPTSAAPAAIAVDTIHDNIYIANSGIGNVSVLPGTGSSTTQVTVGSTPEAIAYNPTNNTIYVANTGVTSGTGAVSYFATGATSSTAINVGTCSTPSALAVDPVADVVYVLCNNAGGAGSVYVINGSGNTVIGSAIAVGSNAVGIAFDALTKAVYVTNEGGSSVTVIDGTTINLTTPYTYTLTTGYSFAGPYGVAVNPATNAVYVTNSTDAALTVINPATPSATLASEWTQTPSGTSGTDSGLAIYATTSASPAFQVVTTTAYSYTGATTPHPTALYYQLDSTEGAWSTATVSTAGNPATFTFSLSSVNPGVHMVYFYSAYGEQGGSQSNAEGSGNSPMISPVGAFPFAVLATTLTNNTVTLALTSGSTSSITCGNSVSFTATVNPAVATGDTDVVDFYSGVTSFGSQSISAGNTTAAQATTALPPGTDYIT